MSTRIERATLFSEGDPPELEIDDGVDMEWNEEMVGTLFPELGVRNGMNGENHIQRHANHQQQQGDGSDSISLYPSAPAQHRLARPYDIETLASTRSLYDTDTEYKMIGGRRYSPGYFMPNDEDEQCRERIEHEVFLTLFSALTTVPLDNPTRILDVGAGTGDWAIEMAEKYKDCDVVGTDLSAIQPNAVPNNVFFEIFDAEDEDDWTYPLDSFDLVHFRSMMGAFSNWSSIYQRAFSHTKPGGWIEVVDYGPQDNFTARFPDDSEIHSWFSAIEAAGRASERGYGLEHLNPDMLTAAGYVDVKSTQHVVPLGMWSKDEKMRKLAKLWLVACLEGLESLSLQPLTQVLGWEPEEVRRVCALIGQEMKSVAMDAENSEGFAVGIRVLVGRKPDLLAVATPDTKEGEGSEMNFGNCTVGGSSTSQNNGHHDEMNIDDEEDGVEFEKNESFAGTPTMS